MRAGADLSASIDRALQQSAFLIVVCSPRAAASAWVDEEITRFTARHGHARVLTVIVAGSANGAYADCFPAALRRSDIDAGAREPIAADLRPGGDGRRMARLKLVAGMLGVDLDDLVRRDVERRQRRLVLITAASVAGMAVTLGLAGAAFRARDEARKQRAQAEGLIGFMLGDLRKRLEPTGRLDLMDGVAASSLAYYSAQDPRSLDDGSLSKRAEALSLMGQISLKRGDLSQALRGFQQAAATTSEILARSPNDGARVFNHAQSVFWVGEVARARGDGAQAEAEYKAYRALAERLIQLDPHSDDWLAELGYANAALGALYLDQGRTAEAGEAFERALPIERDLAARHAADAQRQLELAQGHAYLADVLEMQGRLLDARRERLAELAIYGSVLAKDASIEQAKFSTIVCLEKLGRLALIAGDLSGALLDFGKAAANGEAELAADKGDMDLAGVVASATVEHGEALLAAKRLADADSAAQRASELIGPALNHDPSVILWKNYRDRGAMLQAAILARQGRPDQALSIDDKVMTRLAGDRSRLADATATWLVDRARLQTGDDLAALGRMKEARPLWRAIVQAMPGPITSYEPRRLFLLEAADRRLGQSTAADAIERRLRTLTAGLTAAT